MVFGVVLGAVEPHDFGPFSVVHVVGVVVVFVEELLDRF